MRLRTPALSRIALKKLCVTFRKRIIDLLTEGRAIILLVRHHAEVITAAVVHEQNMQELWDMQTASWDAETTFSI